MGAVAGTARPGRNRAYASRKPQASRFWDVKTVTEYMVKYKALEDAQTEANETAYQRQNFNEGWMLPVRHLGKIDSAEVWASIDEHCAATGEASQPSHAFATAL